MDIQYSVWWHHRLDCRLQNVPLLGRNKPPCQIHDSLTLCLVMKLRLSCAKNDCQNRICACVFAGCHRAWLFLCRQLWAVVLFLPEVIWRKSIHPFTSYTHIDTYTKTLTESCTQSQRWKTSHLVPWQKHFCEKSEWHQLHWDKNGFGPGCWLSNTFWCSSRERFIRTQIRWLTFTPKHISHTERR